MRNVRQTIELSTAFFFSGPRPTTIELHDCGILPHANPSLVPGFYGYSSRREGLSPVLAYANQQCIESVVVEFCVQLDHPINPLQMKPSELPRHDFVSCSRLSRALRHHMGTIFRSDSAGDLSANLENTEPLQTLAHQPSTILRVASDPRWQHVKLIAFKTAVLGSGKLQTVGIVPPWHWQAVTKATCTDPRIQVVLSPPRPLPSHHTGIVTHDDAAGDGRASAFAIPRKTSRVG